MFRHKQAIVNKGDKQPEQNSEGHDLAVSDNKMPVADMSKPEQSLKELIEKNLKWSQIIYEQNRKINNKLLWSAIADWLRVLLIAVPLLLGLLFLPSFFKSIMSQYGDLLGIRSSPSGAQQNSLDNLLKLFNLDPAKQEQLKALLK